MLLFDDNLKEMFDLKHNLPPALLHQHYRLDIELEKHLSPFITNSNTLNAAYFEHVHTNALALFNTLFATTDDITVIVNIQAVRNYYQKSAFLKKYFPIVNRFQIDYCVINHFSLEATEIHSFSIKGTKADIRYKQLITALCNEDFPPLLPRLNKNRNTYVEVVFINSTKKYLLNIYDDRGAVLLLNDQNSYNKFKTEFARDLITY